MARTYGNFTDFIDFSRASSGTYLGSDGLLKTAADNVPRVEYDSNGVLKGLLIEEARTNLVTYSEAFDNSAWVKTNCTVSSNSEVAPDGNSTADTLSFSSVDGLCRFIGSSCSVGETYTNSIWLKAGTATSIKLVILFSGGGLGLTSSTLSLTNDWQRFDITATVPAGTPDTARLRLQSTEIGTVHAWGAQLEQGSFATSYIPTSGAQATRSADLASIATANFGYNQKAGTVVVEASQLQNISGDYNSIVNFGSSSSNRIDIGALNNNGFQSIRESGADSVQYDQNASQNINAYAGGEVSVVALSFNSRSANSSMNGTNGTEDTSVIVPTASVVKVGNDYFSRYLNGHIRSIKYLPRRLSNTQLQEFTS